MKNLLTRPALRHVLVTVEWDWLYWGIGFDLSIRHGGIYFQVGPVCLEIETTTWASVRNEVLRKGE